MATKLTRTIEEQGNRLLVGYYPASDLLDGKPVEKKLHRDFSFRKYGTKAIKRIADQKKKNKDKRPFMNAHNALIELIDTLGDIQFSKLSPGERSMILFNMPFHDVVYMWIRCRMETMRKHGSVLYINTKCPYLDCDQPVKGMKFYLNEMDVEYYEYTEEELNSPEFTYPMAECDDEDLKDIIFRDSAVERITFKMPLWQMMTTAKGETMKRDDDRHRWELQSSIHRIYPNNVPYMREFWDAEGLENYHLMLMYDACTELQAGSDWIAEINCPHCSMPLQERIDWTSPAFFSIARN